MVVGDRSGTGDRHLRNSAIAVGDPGTGRGYLALDRGDHIGDPCVVRRDDPLLDRRIRDTPVPIGGWSKVA